MYLYIEIKIEFCDMINKQDEETHFSRLVNFFYSGSSLNLDFQNFIAQKLTLLILEGYVYCLFKTLRMLVEDKHALQRTNLTIS